MTSVALASPASLLLLGLVAARFLLLLRDRRAGAGAFRFSSLSVVGRGRSFRSALALLPFFVELTGWTLLVVALARPQEIVTVANQRFGIDIVLTLDSSGSMAAEDFTPRNRFNVAKGLLEDFVNMRTNDRIGIVTFGSRAATRVPVTFDHEVAKEVLADTELGEHGDGTAIGHAIATAVNRLRGSEARSRVLILVTDGVNNAGSIEPATAAQLARELGIRIYTIGVGSRGAVPIPIKVQNRFTGEIETIYQMIRADLDEEMLRSIASGTGGEYFRAVDPETLQQVLARIDRLEKSSLAAPRTRTVRELYRAPLAWGVGLLALAIAMGETAWMRLPA